MGKKYVGEFLWHNEEDITCDYFIENVTQVSVFARIFRVKDAYCVELPKKGTSGVRYNVLRDSGSEYVEEYAWVDGKFVLIGTEPVLSSEVR